MKKKNVLFIVVDAVTNDYLFGCPNTRDKAPFLNKLREHAITGNKMYSQAPYTEAALMGLLGSLNTMDEGGYMEKFKNKKTMIHSFREEGYHTFFANYYPSIYPSYMDYGAQELSYIEGFHFSHVWGYRLEHFKAPYLNGSTTQRENRMLEEMVEDNLSAWLHLLKLMQNRDPQTVLLNDCIDRKGLKDTISALEGELAAFRDHKEGYLQELFTQGEAHRLFQLPIYDSVDKIHNDQVRRQNIEKYTPTLERIAALQKKRNLRNARFPAGKLLRNLGNGPCVKGLLAAYKNLIWDKDIQERLSPHYDCFKTERSFRTVADLALDWIDRQQDGEEPWMAYVHPDDAHFNESFFTYDSDDQALLAQEFQKINTYLDRLPKDYCGTLSSDLSLLYCDGVIEHIVRHLEKTGQLSNTSIVITADHGFSFYFYPVREAYVNTGYRENYNVPFLVLDRDIEPRTIPGYLSTKEIPATLLDLAGIPIPPWFKGKSLLHFDGQDYATLEYMGGGCPDLRRRPVQLGIRNDRQDVIAEVFEGKVRVKEVYDMKKDPAQQHNLAKKKNLDISHEVSLIEQRYKQIMQEVPGEES